MTEGIELARERLISDPMSTDPIKNRQHYDAVFTIVGNLGTKAAPLLPDLEAKRVWAIKNAPEVFKSFEASVAVAKGELPSKVRTAVNGSGVLLKSGVQPPLQLGTAKKVMGINSIFGKWVWIAVVVVLLFFGFFNVRMKRKRNDSPGRL